MPHKAKQFIAALLFLMLLFVSIGYYRFESKVNQINETIDAQLFRAAKLGETVVGGDFHDRVQVITPTQLEQNQTMRMLSSLAKIENVVYIYSLVLDRNATLHFTSSSATDEEWKTGENLSYFYDVYDGDAMIKRTIQTTTTDYASLSDKWGNFRSISIGHITPNGTHYSICADVRIDFIHQLIRDSMIKEAGIGFLFWVSIIPLLLLYRNILHQNKQELLDQIKEATEDLAHSRDEAIAANRAKDTFLSNMSHELRTPLNAINGFSQVLLARPDTPEKVKIFIERIYTSGAHLLTLVNTILDFAKIESGKTELFLTSSDVSTLIEEATILVEPLLAEKRLSLVRKSDKSLMLTADRQLIKQVLINLLGNAIKFSPEGDKILIQCIQEEERFVFAIVDHGCGIPKDQVATLFDPFVQVREAQTDSIKGTGLGLSIVKKIVELHGGEIWVESILGKGSSFYFSLPKAVGL
jgi:signal transduction histidine kinase